MSDLIMLSSLFMYTEGWLIAGKMSYIAFNSAPSQHYDPLHLCSSASLWPPFPRLHRRLQTQKLAFHSPKLASQLGRSLILQGFSVDPFRDSNSRHGALSPSSGRVCLHLGGAHSSHAQMHSFHLQNELGARKLSSRELGVCRAFIYTDDVLSSMNRRVLQQHGRKHRTRMRTRAFNPQSGGGGGGDGGRTIFNLAAAGLLTYLTVTGRLNWLFDAILSLWLVSAVLWWFAERSLIRGPCPNCGGEFQVFEFSLKDEHRLCPYCSQPFKLENKKFVRDGPQFSNQEKRGFKQPFGGFGGFEGFGQPTSSQKKEDSAGVIVDIEAEVRDKD